MATQRSMALAGALALSGLLAGPGLAQDDNKIRITFIAHSSFDSAGGFWATIKRGAEQAAADLAGHGVAVEFTGPETEDPSLLPGVINAVVATRPDAIAVSLPSVDAQRDAILAAVEAGIPVVTYNSGVDDFKTVGSMAHVGSIEYDAGVVAGQKLAALGARHVLCSNAIPTNVATVARCQGIEDAMAAAGGKASTFQGSMSDPAAEKSAIDGLMLGDPSIDAVIGIGIPFTLQACLQAKQELGSSRTLYCATFDTFDEAVTGIGDGTVEFAIGQQPFMQGYLPVMILSNYLLYGALPGGASGVIPTGPFVIDESNIEAIMGSISAGTF